MRGLEVAWSVLMGCAAGLCIVILISHAMSAICGRGKYARESNSRDRKGEVMRLEFKPAKGGLISETHMKYKRGGQGGGPMEDHEMESAVHRPMKHAQEHLAAVMGHCFPSGTDKEDDEPNRETAADED